MYRQFEEDCEQVENCQNLRINKDVENTLKVMNEFYSFIDEWKEAITSTGLQISKIHYRKVK